MFLLNYVYTAQLSIKWMSDHWSGLDETMRRAHW